MVDIFCAIYPGVQKLFTDTSKLTINRVKISTLAKQLYIVTRIIIIQGDSVSIINIHVRRVIDIPIAMVTTVLCVSIKSVEACSKTY